MRDWKVSAEVAKLLGIKTTRLQGLLRSGRLVPPERDATGRFIWRDGDVERARKALGIDRRFRAVKEQLAMAGEGSGNHVNG